jgi:bifunctional DNA-binding transcriptional regulator/antitoxin component of YhaV-PrlF toxin-antitoxin module
MDASAVMDEGFGITIPKELLDAAGIVPGSRVTLHMEADGIMVRPLAKKKPKKSPSRKK